MTFDECLRLLDSRLQPIVVPSGFRKTAPGTWNRRIGDDLNVIWVQEHSSNPICCVNLGVHYTFLPNAGTEQPVDGDEIDQIDCEIKLRLTSDALLNDQWWPFSQSTAEQISSLVRNRAIALFDAYKLDSQISALQPLDIENGMPGLLSSLTKVRACLLLARLYDHAGNRTKCIEAATAGLRLAGMAVGPKKALKDILKRCEQSD